MPYEAIRLISLLAAFLIGASTQAAVGYLSRITNAVGHQINITSHDGMGRPLSVTDQNGVVTDLEYNARGWLTKSSVRHGTGDAVTTIEYSLAGDVTKVTLPDGSFLTYTYDDARRLTVITNQAGEKIEFTHDLARNVTAQVTKDSGGTVKRTQSQAYDVGPSSRRRRTERARATPREAPPFRGTSGFLSRFSIRWPALGDWGPRHGPPTSGENDALCPALAARHSDPDPDSARRLQGHLKPGTAREITRPHPMPGAFFCVRRGAVTSGSDWGFPKKNEDAGPGKPASSVVSRRIAPSGGRGKGEGLPPCVRPRQFRQRIEIEAFRVLAAIPSWQRTPDRPASSGKMQKIAGALAPRRSSRRFSREHGRPGREPDRRRGLVLRVEREARERGARAEQRFVPAEQGRRAIRARRSACPGADRCRRRRRG